MTAQTTTLVPDLTAAIAAMDAAPSVHATRPWSLRQAGNVIYLIERTEPTLPQHDPDGRDHTLSCGAAVTNLIVALRAQGLDLDMTGLPDRTQPEIVAKIRVCGAEPPTPRDLAWFAALTERRSHRDRFAPTPVEEDDREAILAAIRLLGVTPRVVRAGDCRPVADLLCRAASAFRADHAYQRELAAWSGEFPQPLRPDSTLPWAGLVRADTHLPDPDTLAERLAQEFLVVLQTKGDTRVAHVLTGMALQRAWLTAVSHGLVASVLTQPWHLPEIRAGLVRELGLPYRPHVLLRIGHPLGEGDRDDTR